VSRGGVIALRTAGIAERNGTMSTIELLRLPQPDALEAAYLKLGDDAVERIAMAISSARCRAGTESGVRVDLPPDLAWRLTAFARDIRLQAAELHGYADSIEADVEWIYDEARDDA
jgi:hypothetical protein